jgi:hypothetical protein
MVLEGIMSIKVLKVAPKDLYIQFEIAFQDLKKVVTALDLAKVQYDSQENPEHALAVIYLEKEFFPLLNKVVEDLEEDMRGT